MHDRDQFHRSRRVFLRLGACRHQSRRATKWAAAKPHPDLFLLACRRLGTAPSETVAIGDSANDAQDARAAGCRVLLVPYGYREGRALEEIECDGVVASLAHAAAGLSQENRTMPVRFPIYIAITALTRHLVGWVG